MTSILIVERLGEIKVLSVKQFDQTELYKKAGFKVADGFDEHATWQVDHKSGSYTISMYAKSKGRAGQENKYDFPPPIDTTLFFGNAVLVRWADKTKTTAANLTVEQWNIVYEELFGGFEDLDDTAEADEADLRREATPELDENGALIPLSKHGYLMDGFIVDDSESLDEDGYETEEEIIVKPAKKRATKAKKSTEEGGDAPAPKKTKAKAKKTEEQVSTEEPKDTVEKAKPKKTKKEKDTEPKKEPAAKSKKNVEQPPAVLPPPPPQAEPQPPIVATIELEEEEYFK
jgi:hypothetical protein